MTIYECLGISEYLMDETIPVDTIIENIDNSDMRYDANVFFNDISRVSIRASFMRVNRYLQVIEITLNSADHINEISFLIQKAIRYQILFVFIYEDRYLLLRRSFNLTMSTEHVYTEHASFCSDWMYKEDLDDENLVYLNVTDVANHYDEDYLSYYQAPKTDNDNGDHRYFADILGNAEKLNNATIESDFISLRFLIDWFNSHAAGYRLSFYDVLDYVRQMESYHIIGENLFVEKNCVSNAICELENSQYRVPIGHTGKNPMFYFKGIKTPATYSAADNLMIFLLYGNITEDEDDGSDDEDVVRSSKKKLELTYEYKESDIRAKAARKSLDNKITLRDYFNGATLPPLLTKDEEFELSKRIENGDFEARKEFILANIRLIVSIAKAYATGAMELDDLIQEGMFGLFNAVDKYDRWRDNKFSTYATYWIKQSIQRTIEDKSSLIRLPVHFQETLGKMKKARNDLFELYGAEPTPDEIAVKAGMSSEKVHEMLLYSDNFIIYDEPIDNKGGTILTELSDEESKCLEQCIYEKDLKERLDAVLETLTPREERVIKMRFGYDDGRPKLLEEVGKEFNTTRERIRQIEAKALRKLRHPSRSNNIKGYLDDEPTFYGIKGRIDTGVSNTKTAFVDEIIRRHRLRGYYLLEDQPLRYSLIRKLRVNGYQMFEQFRGASIDTVDFLSSAMQVELILCMDMRGIRFEECTKDEYPSIHDYIKTHYTCTLCGEPLDGVHLIENKCLCPACKIRLEHLASEKPFTVKANCVEWDDDDLFTKLTITFALNENELLDLPETLELTDAYVILSNDALYRCDSFTLSSVDVDDEDDFLSEDSGLSVVWSSSDYDFNSSNAKYIHLVFKEKNTGSFFLFIFKFNEKGNLKTYDYIGELNYSAYKTERAKQELNIILSTIQEDLCDRTSVETCLENIHLPEIKAVFEQNYIVENGFYYNLDKTCLIMCSENEYIESVVLPQSVETIGRGAFRGVKEIGSITFSNNLTKISPNAFMGVSFHKDIVLPNSITEIGRRAFFRVKVPSDSINIPSMLETLGRHAFPLWWSLRYPNTGASLSECVKEVLSTTNYEVVFGEEHQPTIIESDSNWEFSWELNSANELYITAQGEFAPHRWNSDKETEWRKYAKRIKKLIFSSGITSVAGSAFEGCDNISEVVFPHTLQYLDAFTLKHTLWYKNLDSEYSIVGDECLVKVIADTYTLEIPNNIKYVSRIMDSTLSENKLLPNVRHIQFGNNVKILLPFAFNGSAIESVLFNDGLVEIGQQALASCRELKFLCIPNSVKTIGYGAFSYSSSLECVVLPEKLETINDNAFDGCYWLEKIIVPFDKDEFKKKVQTFWGKDNFPYNKCIYSTTANNRNISKEYELTIRKRTKWESRPITLSNHPNIGERLARTLRKYGIHTIEDLRKWGAKGIWEYVYKRERYPYLSFNSLVKLVLADEDVPEISKERLSELYDFADSVAGYKLERKLLVDSQINEESENLKILPNIGSAMYPRLRSIGITTVADLMQTETEVIWDNLYAKKPTTHYLEIFSIEGAKKGVKIEELDTKRKDELKLYVDRKKGKIVKDTEDITTLPNIGAVMASRLIAAGISTTTILDSKASEDIWDELYQIDPAVDLIEIYAVEGAKQRVKMGDIYFKRKNVLKRHVRAKKSQGK